MRKNWEFQHSNKAKVIHSQPYEEKAPEDSGIKSGQRIQVGECQKCPGRHLQEKDERISTCPQDKEISTTVAMWN